MRDLYKETFDQVRAPQALKQEVCSMTKQERKKAFRKISGAALAAVILVAALAGTALAVSAPGIKEWFDRQWEESSGGKEMEQAQEQAILDLTQDVGESGVSGQQAALPEGPDDGIGTEVSREDWGSTALPATETPEKNRNSVRVTLDSVTVGDSCLWMLLKVSGSYLPGKTYTFAETDLDGVPVKQIDGLGIQMKGSIKYSKDGCRVREDGTLELLIQYQTMPGSTSLLEGGDMELHLKDLLADRELVCQGNWDIAFTLAPVEVPEVVTVDDFMLSYVDPAFGDFTELEVQELEISATGLRYFCAPEDAGRLLCPDVALVLEDGTEVGAGGAHASWEGAPETSRWVTEYVWKLPVTPSRAAALRFGDTVIPLP